MDCLDRTNVAQAAIAKWSLRQQLRAAGILTEKDKVDDHPEFMLVFRSMWADHADYISTAYAGTPALKTDFTRTGKRTREGLARDFWSSITRYAKNNFIDGHRQDAFDVFTGVWIAQGGPSRTSSLLTDIRPPLVRAVPYILFFSLLIIAATLSFTGTGVLSGMYFLTFWATLAVVCVIYIFSHGVEYVNWPRLNPPLDAIYYDGPGYKTRPHGRGRVLSKLPLPFWIKAQMMSMRRKMPTLHKLDEIEMGNGVGRKRVE